MTDDIARRIAEDLSTFIVNELVDASTLDREAAKEYEATGRAFRAAGAELVGGAFMAAAGVIRTKIGG